MFFSLFAFSCSETSANIYRIFNGNWFVDVERIQQNETQKENLFFKLAFANNKTKELDFDVLETNTSNISLGKFHINYQGKGKFEITIYNKSKKLIGKREVELFHNVHPHVSSTGRFNNYVFNFDVISYQSMQLVLIDSQNNEMIIFNMTKDYHERDYIKLAIHVLYVVFLFLLAQPPLFSKKKAVYVVVWALLTLYIVKF